MEQETAHGMHNAFLLSKVQGRWNNFCCSLFIILLLTLQTKENTYKFCDKWAEWMLCFTMACTFITMSCSELYLTNYYSSKSWQILTDRSMFHSKNMLVKKKKKKSNLLLFGKNPGVLQNLWNLCEQIWTKTESLIVCLLLIL